MWTKRKEEFITEVMSLSRAGQAPIGRAGEPGGVWIWCDGGGGTRVRSPTHRLGFGQLELFPGVSSASPDMGKRRRDQGGLEAGSKHTWEMESVSRLHHAWNCLDSQDTRTGPTIHITCSSLATPLLGTRPPSPKLGLNRGPVA